MNKHSIFISFIISFLFIHSLVGQSIGEKFSDAILTRYQPTINEMTHKDWDHSNSIILHGIEKVFLKTRKPEYLDYIQSFADTFIDAKGEVEDLNSELDGIHPGVLCLFLYEETGDEKYKIAASQMRNYLIGSDEVISPFNKTSDGGFWHKNNDHYEGVMTVDGAYMSSPFLVKYGVMFDDQEAVDAAAFQTLLVASRCFNIDNQLMYHGWDSQHVKSWSNRITGTSGQTWSRSMGWYSMALVDVLQYLPASHKGYDDLLYTFQQVAQGVKNTQGQDGMWYQLMTDSSLKNNYPESSGTGMLIYALQKGVVNGWLDKSYEAVTSKGWLALKSYINVYEDGLPVISSFCPGMGIKDNAAAYMEVRPISCPSKEAKQHPHGYCGVLMAASVMEL
ncbi:MAG: glycoside hydrolase family 88 protein [Reichenbachiella sp.]